MKAPDPERTRRAFETVRGAPAAQREAMARAIAEGDETLLRELLSLLRFDTPTEEFGVQIAAAATNAAVFVAPLPAFIGRYRVVRELGAGGFGNVYLAERESPKQLVAIKVLRPFFTDRDARRFRDEADALARLRHPGIAQVYDAGVWDQGVKGGERPYIVMEYVDGATLEEKAAAGPMPARAAAELVSQIADAITHAHQRGVVHRDITAKNVLVDSDGRPKVLDFGLARLLTGGVSAAISFEYMAGTLAYMAPEQLAADAYEVDTRSDVYALGVLAYLLMTDRLPIDVKGVPFVAGAMRVAQASPVRPSAVNREITSELDAIILKALTKSPEERYQAAADLAMDLRRWLRSEPISVRRPTVAYKTRKLISRSPVASSMCAVAVLMMCIAAVWSAQRLTEQRKAHAAAIELLNSLVLMMHEATPILGSHELRVGRLETTLESAQELFAAQPGNERMQAVSARLSVVAAEVYFERREYGREMNARVAAEDAYRKLAATDQSTATIHGWSLSLVKLAECLERSGQREAAFAKYIEALQIDEQLVARMDSKEVVMDPELGDERIAAMSNLFWSYHRMTQIGRINGMPQAEMWREKSKVTAQEMMDTDPKSWRSMEAWLELVVTEARELQGSDRFARVYELTTSHLPLCLELLNEYPNRAHLHALAVKIFGGAAEAAMELEKKAEAAMLAAQMEELVNPLRDGMGGAYFKLFFTLAAEALKRDMAFKEGNVVEATACLARSVALMEASLPDMVNDETFCFVYAQTLMHYFEHEMRATPQIPLDGTLLGRIQAAIGYLEKYPTERCIAFREQMIQWLPAAREAMW